MKNNKSKSARVNLPLFESQVQDYSACENESMERLEGCLSFYHQFNNNNDNFTGIV